MRTHHPRWTALAALVAAALIATSAQAQFGVFGTQVKVGDQDHAPVTKGNGIALRVNEAEFGVAGVARDNCLIIDTASTPAAGAQNKDLRLTPCWGKAAGSLVEDSDVQDTTATYAQRTTTAQFADLNANVKYDKGEPIYVTTADAGSLAATGATGTWTVRLLGTAHGAAGTFVFSTDEDFRLYGASTLALPDGPAVVEREDKQWYLVHRKPGAATVDKSIPKGSAVPSDSIRLGGPAADSPDVRVTALKVLTATPRAKMDLQAALDIVNGGKAAGIGLVVSKIDGVLVDARLTPVMDPGETGTVLVSMKAPAKTGPVELRVGDMFQVITLDGAAPSDPTSDLLARISALEARIAELEGKPAIAAEAVEAENAVPGLDLAATVTLFALVTFLARRRFG